MFSGWKVWNANDHICGLYFNDGSSTGVDTYSRWPLVLLDCIEIYKIYRNEKVTQMVLTKKEENMEFFHFLLPAIKIFLS
jgi:hypothetical protein